MKVFEKGALLRTDEEQTIPEEAELVSLQPTSSKLQTIPLEFL